jgi:hypothetical protein
MRHKKDRDIFSQAKTLYTSGCINVMKHPYLCRPEKIFRSPTWLYVFAMETIMAAFSIGFVKFYMVIGL